MIDEVNILQVKKLKFREVKYLPKVSQQVETKKPEAASEYLLTAYYVSGTTLSISYVFTYFILTTILRDKYHFYKWENKSRG